MYNVLMADPPWPQKKGGLRKVCPRQGRRLDYETLSLSENFRLLEVLLLEKAEKQHSLFLWTIDKFLAESDEWAKSFGYRRHTRLIWDKCNGVAPAFTVRFSHEYLCWYYMGKFTPVAPEIRGKLMTVIREPAREHSRKPDASYSMIEQLYPQARRLSLFSRGDRTGWDHWGDEVGKFNDKGRQYEGSANA